MTLARALTAVLVIAPMGAPIGAHAQGSAPTPTDAPAAVLPPVGVTATRGAKPIDEVPATVSIIDERELDRRDAVRPSDIVRYEPGVSVGNQPARGGQTNYVIRGIGGNRVLVLQDGLRVQDFPGSNIGAGNYNRLTGSLKIGLNGLISFSSRPLSLMSIGGALLAGFSFLVGGWYVFQKLIGIDLTPGLSTTVLFVSFFAGVQLLGLGLLGEYVGRIYDEVKRRPMYIVDRRANFE